MPVSQFSTMSRTRIVVVGAGFDGLAVVRPSGGADGVHLRLDTNVIDIDEQAITAGSERIETAIAIVEGIVPTVVSL